MRIIATIKNLPPVAKAVSIGSLLVLLLMVVIIIAGVMQITKLAEYTKQIYRHPLVVSNAVQSANYNIVSIHRYMKDVALAKTEDDLENALISIKREELNALKEFNIVENRFLGDKSRIKHLRNEFKAWSNIRDKVINLSREQKHDEAMSITKGEGADYVDNLIKHMDEIILYARNKANQFALDSDTQYQKSKFNLITLGSIVIISGIFIGLYILITARKSQKKLLESEERFRSAFENVSVGNILINESGIIESFNSIAENIFGYKKNEVLGKNINMLMPEPYKGEHDEYIKNYIKTKNAKVIGIGREVTGLRNNGEQFPMQLGIGEIRVDNKISFIGSIRDLSDIKKLEAQLNKRQRMEVTGQLSGGVAHYFNNLLAIILGNLELVQSNNSKNLPTQKYFDHALDAVKRSAALTQQLLSYSRQQNLNPEIINSGDIIKDNAQFIDLTMGDEIKLITNINEKTLPVYIDPSMFSNALLNIALNARDAMPDGGAITIENSFISIDEDLDTNHSEDEIKPGAYTLISITDTGSGIAPDVINKIYEPFFSTKETGKGSGMGLSMVHGFLHQSNGYIRISSELNKGTHVSIYLPQVNESGLSKTNPSAHLSYGSRNETILLVEDEPLVAEMNSLTLSELGFNVLNAEDADSALAIIKSNSSIVDLLFTDVIMPGEMNGVELAKHVIEQHPHIKVVLTSGFPEEVLKNENLTFTLLPKPFTRQQLLMTIETTMSNE